MTDNTNCADRIEASSRQTPKAPKRKTRAKRRTQHRSQLFRRTRSTWHRTCRTRRVSSSRTYAQELLCIGVPSAPILEDVVPKHKARRVSAHWSQSKRSIETQCSASVCKHCGPTYAPDRVLRWQAACGASLHDTRSAWYDLRWEQCDSAARQAVLQPSKANWTGAAILPKYWQYDRPGSGH